MLRPQEARALPLSKGAIVAVGDDGRIAYCSPAALALLGWSDRLIGRPFPAIIPGRLKAAHHDAFAKLSSSRRPLTASPQVQPVLAEDGREVLVQVAVVVYRRPDTSLFLCAALSMPDAPWPSLGAAHFELSTNGYSVVAPDQETLRVLPPQARHTWTSS